MKTILIALTLSLALLALGAAQRDADAQRLEERQRQQEQAAEGEKAVAALRKDLAGAWTSVIVAVDYHCSCLGSSYHGFCLRREGGAVTVEPWRVDGRMAPVGVPRPIAQPVVERLLSEAAVYFLAANQSVAPSEKAGPMPVDAAGQKEWFARYLAAGGSAEGADTFSVEVRVSTAEGERRHHDLWARDCPKDFTQWVAQFGTLP